MIGNMIDVAPLVGAWIEISKYTSIKGSKSPVAPLVGAWIEIKLSKMPPPVPVVAPLVGAWIEI